MLAIGEECRTLGTAHAPRRFATCAALAISCWGGRASTCETTSAELVREIDGRLAALTGLIAGDAGRL